MARKPGSQTAIRYAMVSVVSVAVSQVSLFVLFALFHWTARSANVMAFCIAGFPSYYLNRTWAWGKSGRSHLLKEVLPFWGIALVGLAISTWAADFAESRAANLTGSRSLQGLLVSAAAIGAFGVVWVVKFAILHKFLFGRTKDEGMRPAALADEAVG